MEVTRPPDLREQIRLTILEHYPDSSPEQVDKTVSQIMLAVDPVEKSAAKMLDRYRETFARLAK